MTPREIPAGQELEAVEAAEIRDSRLLQECRVEMASTLLAAQTKAFYHGIVKHMENWA